MMRLLLLSATAPSLATRALDERFVPKHPRDSSQHRVLAPAWRSDVGDRSAAGISLPEVVFEEPVMIGPASTPNGTICSCDFASPPSGSGLKDVCSHLPGVPWVPVHVYSACDGGAPYFFGLGNGKLFGSMGGDRSNMGYYTSTDNARSWQHPVRPMLPATALGLNYNQPPSSGFLLPAGPGRLHSCGPGLSLVGGLPAGNLTAPNYTQFTMNDNGTLNWTVFDRSVSFHGAPLSAACAAPGHVNPTGLRLGGAGATKLAGGGYFHIAVGCLGAAPKQPSYAASLLGFVSDDGFDWKYAGPIIHAADFPTSMVGPTENAVTQLSDNKTLLVVARTDADGHCDKPKPAGSQYHEYIHTLSTDRGKSWKKPSLVVGAGCVRPKLLTLTDGAVLLSGGRECYANRTDVSLWAATPKSVISNNWRRYSLSGQHNALWKGDPQLRFQPDSVNTSYSAGMFLGTLSYTSLVSLGPSLGVVTYDLRLPEWQGLPSVQFGFSMRFRVKVDE